MSARDQKWKKGRANRRKVLFCLHVPIFGENRLILRGRSPRGGYDCGWPLVRQATLPKAPPFDGRTTQNKTLWFGLSNDPETDVVPGVTRDRKVRSSRRCSMCPAIHITSRSWLRSSSTHEPSDPPLRVVYLIFVLFQISELNKVFTCEHRQSKKRQDQGGTARADGEGTFALNPDHPGAVRWV